MALLHKAVLTPSKLELLQAWVPAQPWALDVATSALVPVGSYRFDDPDGEVGIETMLLRSGDAPDGGSDAAPVLHVPLTYRSAPLDGAEQWLIGTTEHSVLGPRWVYDACGDPVYAGVLATVILNGGSHVEQHWVIGGVEVPKPLDTLVEGTGGAALLGGGGDAATVAAGAAGAAPAVLPVAAGGVMVEAGPESTIVRMTGLVLEVLRRVTGEGALTAAEAASAARGDAAAAVAGTGALLLGRWPGEPDPRLLASATRVASA